MAEIKNNTYKIDKNDLDKIKKNFISEMLDENETVEMIKTINDEHQIVVDPHTAVGIGAVRKLGLEKNCVVLSTAHPCKFPKAIEDAISKTENLPESLKYVNNRKELWTELDHLNSEFEISWNWVKAHSTDKLNNEVDLLAKNAAKL